jgi:hypothetical protein
MRRQSWEHQRPERDQAVCAWGIVLALAILFGGLELLWPSTPVRTSGFEAATIQQAVAQKQEDASDEGALAGLRQSEFPFERWLVLRHLMVAVKLGTPAWDDPPCLQGRNCGGQRRGLFRMRERHVFLFPIVLGR